MEEIVVIARRIPRVWREVASLARLFETYEIDDIMHSRVDLDESTKALTMLTRYMEWGGTRQKLAGALEKLGLTSLSEDVLSGSFINTGEEE